MKRTLHQLYTYIPLTYPIVRNIFWDMLNVHSEGAAMEQGAVFQSNRSQAIRLPKAVALPDDVKRVDIVAVGRTRIIAPAGEVWDSWFEGNEVTSDFMSDRDQPALQEREAF